MSIDGDYVEFLDDEQLTLVQTTPEVSIELEETVWFLPGPSAYQVWLDAGNTGDLATYLAMNQARILWTVAAPTAGLGYVGYWAIDTVLWNVYEKTDAVTWTLRGNIKGATGPQGIQGTPGTGSVNLPTLVTNLILDPSFEAASPSWTGSSTQTTSVKSTVQKYTGSNSLAVTMASDPAEQAIRLSQSGLTVGQVYTFSFYIYNPTTGGVPGGLRPSVATIAYGYSTTIRDAWVRLTQTFVATATTHLLSVNNVATNAGTFYIDAVQLEIGNQSTDYFDGSFAGCYWTGTAHASTSVKGLYDGDDVVRKEQTPELARNLVYDPSVKAITGHYSDAASSVALSTGTGYLGTNSVLLTKTASSGNATDQWDPQNTVNWQPAAVGSTYTVSCYVEALDAGVSFYIAPGQGAQSSPVSIPVGPPVLVRHTFTTTGNTSGRIYLTLASATPLNARVRISCFMLEAGQKTTGYFDGNTPGCRWTGTPNASESIKYLFNATDRDLLTWLDAGRALGKGSPEGVVTAPVGTEYKDTLATNGVIKWIKQIGTGSTGWYSAPTIPSPSSTGGYVDNAAVGPAYLNGSPASSLTGAVQIAIPVASTLDVMLEVEVELWSFDSDGITKSTLRATCYSQTNGGMTRGTARITSSGQFKGQTQPITYPAVRWIRATGGTTLWLTIGNVGDVNAYLQAKIARVSSHYMSGGSIGQPTVSLVTTLPTGNTLSVPLVDTLGVYRGTGSPEAVVAAPVGSEYVDLAATNGAIKWIKVSGTGTTGWKVAYGDTGWRVLVAWNAAGAYTYADGTVWNSTDWQPSAATGAPGGIYIRRVNERIESRIVGAETKVTSPGSVFTIPVGFQADARAYPIIPVTAYRSGAPVVIQSWTGTGRGASQGFTIGDHLRHIAPTWSTADAWPATLPGAVA